MKSLFIFIVALCGFQAHAADTSGCSPLLEQRKTVKTALGLSLTVTVAKAKAGCWNADQASVRVTYEWLQQNPYNPAVLFWLRVNNSSGTVNANVSCSTKQNNTVHADTSGRLVYKCTADAAVAIGAASAGKSVDIEVAPQINRTWDTAGYEQNYGFKF